MRLLKIPKGSTVPIKDHLIQVWKQTGKKPKQLEDLPDCPEDIDYLWEWYREICIPPNPITYAEIKSWAELARVDITPREVKALRIIDATRLKVLRNE